ncbi:MAG: hypothetical protein E6600_01055 [Anaerocolumna aminovalerica]|jgi:hypothetical protein|nr:hypothetical protein [Anaerocolumna aminovalerica]MDU6263069.1 hypothetical protein [Anaerocolumna aminovalerica]
MASHIEDINPLFLVGTLDMAVKKNIPVQEEVWTDSFQTNEST